MERRDAPGLVRFCTQVVFFLGACSATVSLTAADSVFAWPAVAVAGVALVLFFPSLHEAGHGTAFRTRWLNEVVVWLSAALNLQAPRFFREFHWEHHRSTQDPLLDPEIRSAPSLLDDWPQGIVAYLLLVSGQGLLVGKLGFTVLCAVLPRVLVSKFFSFIPERALRRVGWESRAVLTVLVAVVWTGFVWIDGFPLVLLAWPIAHLVLGFYLMPEHTGLPNSGSQNERTRSVESALAVRWAMWNMPLHAVHHMQPGVPFHAVPELHRLLEPRLEHVSAGYFAFHREALARLFAKG